MRALGLHGARRGKAKRTTIADPAASRAKDLVMHNFRPLAPNRLWVADFPYVSTRDRWVYVPAAGRARRETVRLAAARLLEQDVEPVRVPRLRAELDKGPAAWGGVRTSGGRWSGLPR